MEHRGLEFYFWTTTNIQDRFFPCSDNPAQPQLQLVLAWLSPRIVNFARVLTSAFNAMNLSFLTQLQISIDDYIGSKTWVKTFGKFPRLEQVCTRYNSTHSFLEALVYKSEAAEKSKTAYRKVSFPKLLYIHVKGGYFPTTTSHLPSTSVDKLLDYLMERCERNAEVQVLHLVECDISSNIVERLKEVVVDVIWDGIEGQLEKFDGSIDDSLRP